MAILLIEGYDHLATGDIVAKGWSSGATSMQAGRWGGQCERRSVSATIASKTLGSTYSTIFLGFAYRASSFGAGGILAAIRATATSTLGLFLDGSNHLQIKNSGATVIATGTTVLSLNTWYFIEIKLVVNGASGTCELHLNGVSGEIASTTGNFGSVNVDNIGFAAPGTSTDIDDIYVCDTSGSAPNNTFLGDVRVETLFPNADGTHTSFTPHPAGSHFSNIDETTPDGDTSYNADSNVGDMDTYLTPGILAGSSVSAIQVNLYARKDDAGLRQVAPVVRQAATDYAGNTNTLGSNYLFYSQIYNADPTSATWTANNVNADEYGIEVVG